VLNNSIEQMLIEGASLETRHRHRFIGVASLLTRFQFGDIHRAQTGIEVKVQFGFGAGLAIAQTRKLFGIAEDKLNGMITNDKFCCTRWGELQLSWWRRPLRLRRTADEEKI
jgi:hypothetical protein